MAKQYTPNLDDLRIQKRAKKAYAFCIAVASRDMRGNTLSTKWMSKHLGNIRKEKLLKSIA